MQNKQKNGRKTKRNTRKAQTVARVSAQPRNMLVTFGYTARGTLTEAAAGVGATYTYRLNSLWDPNLTGVGLQPVGFDQWAGIFRRSRVVRADVTVAYVNTTAGTAAIRAGFYPSQGATSVPADPDAFKSQYGSRSNLIGGSGKTVTTVRSTFDISKILGVPRATLMGDLLFSEDMSLGPSVSSNYQALLVLFIAGFGSTGVANYEINIKYHADLSMPAALNVS